MSCCDVVPDKGSRYFKLEFGGHVWFTSIIKLWRSHHWHRAGNYKRKNSCCIKRPRRTWNIPLLEQQEANLSTCWSKEGGKVGYYQEKVWPGDVPLHLHTRGCVSLKAITDKKYHQECSETLLLPAAWCFSASDARASMAQSPPTDNDSGKHYI